MTVELDGGRSLVSSGRDGPLAKKYDLCLERPSLLTPATELLHESVHLDDRNQNAAKLCMITLSCVAEVRSLGLVWHGSLMISSDPCRTNMPTH